MPAEMIAVKEITMPGQAEYGGQAFPLLLQCDSPGVDLEATLDWVRARRDWLDAKATEHGAILFRGFPLPTPEDFDAFIAAFDYPNFAYEDSLSNAVRVVRTERVFSANEAPPSVTIFFHHEMAQTPLYPSKLFFYCERRDGEGGATPLCRSDVLVDRLREECPQFVADCEQKGLKYSNVMPAVNDAESGMGRSWQSTLRADSPEQAEARLRDLGYSWEWLPDGCLRATTPVLPAVREISPRRKTFFNQLIAAFKGWKDTRNDPSKAITFGDGSPLDAAAVHRAAELADELAFDVPWQPGDVALVDNYITMHGRRTFTGTRKVWASLVAADGAA
jgi:alpha-ketoglutarate-dependent taurine dioxygenase